MTSWQSEDSRRLTSFSTISKQSSTSSTVKARFPDTLPGHLPLGFLALDLAQALNLPLIDPDDNYKMIADGTHTKFGNGLIGGDRSKVVATNGGSDLIYLPDGDKEAAKRIVDYLLTQDYVSSVFVDSCRRQHAARPSCAHPRFHKNNKKCETAERISDRMGGRV